MNIKILTLTAATLLALAAAPAAALADCGGPPPNWGPFGDATTYCPTGGCTDTLFTEISFPTPSDIPQPPSYFEEFKNGVTLFCAPLADGNKLISTAGAPAGGANVYTYSYYVTPIDAPFDAATTFNTYVGAMKGLTPARKDEVMRIGNWAFLTGGGFGIAATLAVTPFPFDLFAAMLATFGAASNLVASDPPDPNYKVIAEPSFLSFPSQDLPTCAVPAMTTLSQGIGYDQVMYITFNRYQGAIQASDAYWTSKQLKTLDGYIINYKSTLANINQDLPGVWSCLGSMPITNAQVGTAQSQIAANGLSTSLLNAFAAISEMPENFAGSIVTIKSNTLDNIINGVNNPVPNFK